MSPPAGLAADAGASATRARPPPVTVGMAGVIRPGDGTAANDITTEKPDLAGRRIIVDRESRYGWITVKLIDSEERHRMRVHNIELAIPQPDGTVVYKRPATARNSHKKRSANDPAEPLAEPLAPSPERAPVPSPGPAPFSSPSTAPARTSLPPPPGGASKPAPATSAPNAQPAAARAAAPRAAPAAPTVFTSRRRPVKRPRHLEDMLE